MAGEKEFLPGKVPFVQMATARGRHERFFSDFSFNPIIQFLVCRRYENELLNFRICPSIAPLLFIFVGVMPKFLL